MNDQPATSGETAASPTGGPLNESVASSSQRIELIIEAAERAAAGIIADAEAQARSYLEQSRQRADQIASERSAGLSELADSLMTRAESVKQQSADLIEALESARSQIAARLTEDVKLPPLEVAGPDSPAGISDDAATGLEPVAPAGEAEASGESPTDEAEIAPAVEEAAEEPAPAPAAAEPPPPPSTARATGPASAGARLLATQMAVAGSSRDEIASRLENEFGIADPDEMLDGILGPRT